MAKNNCPYVTYQHLCTKTDRILDIINLFTIKHPQRCIRNKQIW